MSASEIQSKARSTGETERSIEEVLHKESYTVGELAMLIDMPVWAVEQEAFAGRLKAMIVDHHILAIRRADALAWLIDRRA